MPKINLIIPTHENSKIQFQEFDNDNEMPITISIDENNEEELVVYLSPNQINEAITFMAAHLIMIGEPVDIVTQLNSKTT